MVVSFNPVLGFLPAATYLSRLTAGRDMQFQSRAGFSPCCDAGLRRPSTVESYVSIPCWVFSLLRRRRRPKHDHDPLVSIPCWVFSLLRPIWDQPDKDDSWVFQSRAGFSPCCDIIIIGHDGRDVVSIPCWVFSLLRLADRQGPASLRGRFNPVLGFLPAATSLFSLSSPVTNCFNPVLGFLPAATSLARERPIRQRVSIPCWVFSLLRPGDCDFGKFPEVFQSRAGFSPCCDLPRPRRPLDRDGVSIPCWVFSLLRRNGNFANTHLIDAVSIPCWVFSLLRQGV